MRFEGKLFLFLNFKRIQFGGFCQRGYLISYCLVRAFQLQAIRNRWRKSFELLRHWRDSAHKHMSSHGCSEVHSRAIVIWCVGLRMCGRMKWLPYGQPFYVSTATRRARAILGHRHSCSVLAGWIARSAAPSVDGGASKLEVCISWLCRRLGVALLDLCLLMRPMRLLP